MPVNQVRDFEMDLYKYVVPVHRVIDSVRRNEDVSIELWYR